MALFEKLKQNLTTAGQVTAEKAKKTADILKIKDQIRQDKREIRNLTYKIGQTYIDLHSEDYEEDYEDYFVTMAVVRESLNEKIRELRELNAREKAAGKCTECGAEISPFHNYCPNCGAAVAYDTELKEEMQVDEMAETDMTVEDE